MDVALNTRLIELTRKKSQLQDQIDVINDELNQLRDVIAKQFVQEGTQNWKGQDGSMIFLRRRIYASMKSGIDPQMVCDAMRKNGLDFLVTTKPDTNGIVSWIREREEENSGIFPRSIEDFLPDEVRGLFEFSEQITPAVRGT